MDPWEQEEGNGAYLKTERKEWESEASQLYFVSGKILEEIIKRIICKALDNKINNNQQ